MGIIRVISIFLLFAGLCFFDASVASASIGSENTRVADATPMNGAASGPSSAKCDPYQNFGCLDAYLGDGFFERLGNYYALEWEQAGPPVDPQAPAGRRDGWPATPETIPPMPYTEWPYGGTTALGVTRPASVDSPLMAAMGNSWLGKMMADGNAQIYGWINAGGNISTSSTPNGGNSPAAYSYRPNTIDLDQAVLYVERLPDTVQSDHVDWGYRLSAIYGTNYRYTTSYGLASYQLLSKNRVYGYDFPMMYGELFIPQVAEGLMFRLGRFISLPDIEAQLAPNNYMYSHSMTYTFDNYTNTGLQSTLAVTKQLFIQLGLTVGTEAPVWHLRERITNPYPNPIYPDSTFKKDPGAQPSFTACVRYNTASGNDDVNVCADAINKGNYGYNNLQWFGGTLYHKFNDKWHLDYEAYYLYQKDVPNQNNAEVQTINAMGGTPFTAPEAGIKYNAPDEAQCENVNDLTCKAEAYGTVAYLSYSPNALNNISFRPEFFWDRQGQRTGTATRYGTLSLGWQHWVSPQIELRPEIAMYRSFNGNAFNGNANGGIAPDSNHQTVVSGDFIFHF